MTHSTALRPGPVDLSSGSAAQIHARAIGVDRIDLSREFHDALNSLTWRTAKWLLDEHRVPAATSATLCGGILARFDSGFFEIDAESGTPALTVCAGWRDPNGFYREIDDLVAFRPAFPHQWALRIGSSPILGQDELERAVFFHEPLSLYADPLAWLRASGSGVVILDWGAHLPIWFANVSSIVCENLRLARRIDSALRSSATALPEIRVLSDETFCHAS